MPRAKFYATLNKLKIKKGTSESANLSRFLKVSGKEKEADSGDMLSLVRLVKVIEEFLRNHYLKSFGYKKRRLALPKDATSAVKGIDGAEYDVEEEYYYDEEVPENET